MAPEQETPRLLGRKRAAAYVGYWRWARRKNHGNLVRLGLVLVAVLILGFFAWWGEYQKNAAAPRPVVEKLAERRTEYDGQGTYTVTEIIKVNPNSPYAPSLLVVTAYGDGPPEIVIHGMGDKFSVLGPSYKFSGFSTASVQSPIGAYRVTAKSSNDRVVFDYRFE